MYSGKLTFSTPSTHKKNHVKCWRDKNSGQMNGFKKYSCLQQFTQPSPPLLSLGPSEVKWLAPKCVWTSFMKRTLVVRFLQGATSSKQPLNLIILIVFICEVQNNVVQATLLATLRMAQLVLSIFLPIFHAK